MVVRHFVVALFLFVVALFLFVAALVGSFSGETVGREDPRSMFQWPPVFLNPPDEKRNDPKPGCGGQQFLC